MDPARFAGQDAPVREESVRPDDTLVPPSTPIGRTGRVDEVVDSAPSLDELCRNVGDEAPANLRWVLMHLLEETARHAGHADILRELIDGQTGR